MILTPLVQGSNRIVSRTVQAWALPVTIRRDSAAESTVYILGGGTLPSVLPQSLVPADAGVAADDIDMVSLHDWKPSNFPWPFWVVKRCENRSDANCHISHCLARTVGTTTHDFAFTDACEVNIPIMINFAPIEKTRSWLCIGSVTLPRLRRRSRRSIGSTKVRRRASRGRRHEYLRNRGHDCVLMQAQRVVESRRG